MMVVHAMRDIAAGGEIFFSYVNPEHPFAERRKKLRDGYGFECGCDLCRAEADVRGAALEKRARLRAEIHSFVSAHRIDGDGPHKAVPAVQKAKASKLLHEMRETYPPARFERLPRLGCCVIGLWVALAAMTRSPGAAHGRFLDVLRDLGCFVTVWGSEVTVDRGRAVWTETGLHAAMYAAQCLAATGNEVAASALEALGKEIYVALYGVEDGFEAESGRNS
ncbi:hypothetical protein VTK73DRAFT_5444 [Phialemonium thermophilum]|uniref:SET domain-containing protein n=1 Tax=Phialemonium thermophilum TaxID=223376 RepID=A0ABR3V1W1_9PEZI